MGMTSSGQADALTARLAYEPRDRALFVIALTHRSAGNLVWDAAATGMTTVEPETPPTEAPQ